MALTQPLISQPCSDNIEGETVDVVTLKAKADYLWYYSTSILIILISSSGLSVLVTLTFSIAWMTSSPATARPKMVCLRSSQGVAVVVINHWEPLWFGWPGFAIDTVYGLGRTRR